MRWDHHKSIHCSGDFVIGGFVSIYFAVILPAFQLFFTKTGSLLYRAVNPPHLQIE